MWALLLTETWVCDNDPSSQDEPELEVERLALQILEINTSPTILAIQVPT